jgi:hypothetical protein
MFKWFNVLQILPKITLFYSNTRTFCPGLMLYLSTFLHCKRIFLVFLLVILNKAIIFAVCYYNTRTTKQLNFATMKKETLQARIEKHLYTKGGSLAKKYEEVVELLNNPERTMRPVYWAGHSRNISLHDSSANLEQGLSLLGIDYETGNDAPKGGKNGYFVRLTAKGKRQVKDFAKR